MPPAQQEFLGNEQFLNERASVLNNLCTSKSLTTIVDYGYNKFLYDKLVFDRIICIERENFYHVPDPRVTYVLGNYEILFKNYLQDNTCYSFFSFEVNAYIKEKGLQTLPLRQQQLILKHAQEEESRKRNFQIVKSVLYNSGLKNSFLVLWTRKPDFQSYQIFNVETQTDITNEIQA